MINLKYPSKGGIVPISTPDQKAFLKMDRKNLTAESKDWLNLEKQGMPDRTFPLPVSFVWEAERIANLFLSETEDFKDFLKVRGDKTAKIENLKAGTRYYWKVKCGKEESETFYFDTESNFPRWIRIDGVTNVRDIGGWRSGDGKRVRQGILYRGSELNSHVKITADGLKTMRDALKIKSVLDLRGDTELVRDVYKGRYLNVPVKAYGEFFDNKEDARKVFSFIAEKENHPIYMHCWGGADRTGTTAMLLGALLGVGLQEIIDDYEITTLSIWGVRSRNTDWFLSVMERLDEYDGENITRKCENFLSSCGVTDEEIKSLREIFLC